MTATTTGTQTPYLTPERGDRITVRSALGNQVDIQVTTVTQVDDGTANLIYRVAGKVLCGGQVTRDRATAVIRSGRDWRSAPAW